MSTSSKSVMPQITSPASRNYINDYVAKNGINFVNASTAGSSYMATSAAQLRTGSPGGIGFEQNPPPGMEGGEEADESSLEGAASDAVPEMAIAQMASKLGSGLNNIISGVTNYNINSDYINTISTGHGIGLTESAVNQATGAYAKSSLESLGGSLGALFGGPVGMLAGRGLASLFETPITGAVAYSSQGRFNPQSGTTPQSQSSRQPGETGKPEEPAPVQFNASTSTDNDSASSPEPSTSTDVSANVSSVETEATPG